MTLIYKFKTVKEGNSYFIKVVEIDNKFKLSRHKVEYFFIDDILLMMGIKLKKLQSLAKEYQGWLNDKILFPSRQAALKFAREHFMPSIVMRTLSNQSIYEDIFMKMIRDHHDKRKKVSHGYI